MKISMLKNKFFFTTQVMILLVSVGVITVSVAAQKFLAPLPNPSVNLFQCRNGATGTDPCAGNNWVPGNVGQSNSQYSEDEYVPYRMLFDDLVPGPDATAHVYTLIIGYDTTHGGPSAIDYLGTYNTRVIDPRNTSTVVTRAGVDPCTDHNACVGPITTVAITQDTLTVVNPGIINPNTGLQHYQPTNQVFTMWGGTLRSFSYTNFTVGADNKRQVTITFTAQVANPVLAWSGHIGWLGDWGVGNSAGGIQGSPYHMRLIALDGSGGNQDRSLSADAVIPSGAVFIKKVVNTLDLSGSAVFEFPFTATANFGPTSFGLIDDNGGAGVDTQQSQAITSFGPGNLITVTECSNSLVCPTYPVGWSLAGVSCVESGVQNSTGAPGVPWVPGGPANITVEVGETVTCTFTNTQFQPSAATVAVSGRVMTGSGVGVSNARVSMTDQNGNTISAITNRFGYYRFSEVEVGQTYVMNVGSKRYQFAPRVISLSDELTNLDFIAF